MLMEFTFSKAPFFAVSESNYWLNFQEVPSKETSPYTTLEKGNHLQKCQTFGDLLVRRVIIIDTGSITPAYDPNNRFVSLVRLESQQKSPSEK